MAKSAAERMAAMRLRQRKAGLCTLTVVVPRSEAAEFRSLARSRCHEILLPPSADRRGQPRLRIAAPPAAARSAIRVRDILQFRELLEVAAVELVVARLNPAIERRLRALLAWEQRLDGGATGRDLQRVHAVLGELSGDAALRFLLRVALQLTDDHASFSGRRKGERDAAVARIRHVHARIVEAVLKRDARLAQARMRRYIAGLQEWLA